MHGVTSGDSSRKQAIDTLALIAAKLRTVCTLSFIQQRQSSCQKSIQRVSKEGDAASTSSKGSASCVCGDSVCMYGKCANSNPQTCHFTRQGNAQSVMSHFNSHICSLQVVSHQSVVTCEGCEGRFHRDCVGVDAKLTDADDWYCPACASQQYLSVKVRCRVDVILFACC